MDGAVVVTVKVKAEVEFPLHRATLDSCSPPRLTTLWAALDSWTDLGCSSRRHARCFGD